MPDRIFVYGSLRKGGGLDGLWPAGASFAEATMQGILYEHTGGAYPVMVPLVGSDSSFTVQGDLVTVPDIELVASIVSMEVGAGYNVQHAIAQNALGYDVRCLVFAWPWSDKGPIIQSGDWLEHAERPPRGNASHEFVECRACGELVHIADCDDFGPQWGFMCPDCTTWDDYVLAGAQQPGTTDE